MMHEVYISEIIEPKIVSEQLIIVDEVQIQKKENRKIVIGLITGFLVFGCLLFPYLDQKQKLREAEANYEELSLRLEEVNCDANNKQQQIDYLNDDEYIADIARRDFFMSKDGEVIYSTSKDE